MSLYKSYYIKRLHYFYKYPQKRNALSIALIFFNSCKRYLRVTSQFHDIYYKKKWLNLGFSHSYILYLLRNQFNLLTWYEIKLYPSVQ